MFDIRWIRDNRDEFDEKCARRGLKPLSGQLLALDRQRRDQVQAMQELQQQRNAASKKIGQAMAGGDKALADRLKAEVSALKGDLQSGEEAERRISSELTAALGAIPNVPLDEVPAGAGEDDNVEVRRVGSKPEFDFEPRQHFDIGEALGGMDFETAGKVSGARFVYLTGDIARLERALGQFMLDLQTGENGFDEVSPPLLVRDEAAFGSGQLPKFSEDLFQTTDGRWLIPTAEVPLANMVREKILTEDELPVRLTALTPCFRSEAGSAGRDTRGMIRQHQFSKVELVSVTTPQTSRAELERMTGCAEQVLKRLGLHYRVVTLCTGDMGFSSAMTYDLEVWLPGQNAYREISSCSVCGDFQARRMNARYRPAQAAKTKGTRFVHTLNGSGLAVGRTLVAVLENYQNADGSVTIPDVLVPFMAGRKTIGG